MLLNCHNPNTMVMGVQTRMHGQSTLPDGLCNVLAAIHRAAVSSPASSHVCSVGSGAIHLLTQPCGYLACFQC